MSNDPRIDILVRDVEEIKKQVCENTTVVTEVRNILKSFKLIAAVAKWIAVVGGGLTATYMAIHGAITHFNPKP